jgi:ADP-ribosylglycohydrolase
MSNQNQARAILYGLALGDALGWPIQFLNMRKITVIYGEKGIQQPPDPALFTDDTQMTLAITQALIEAGESDTDVFMQAVTRHLIAWFTGLTPENDRASGYTVGEVVRTLQSGVHWQESGDPHAKGCGSVNRVATIGYLFQHDPARLKEVALASGQITHAHPTAQAATVAAAYMIKLALDGVSPENYPRMVLEFVDGMSDELHDAILRVGHVTQWPDELAALEHIGNGWIAEETVALALYCTMRAPEDYTLAVQRAVNHKGASDSVGCITGGVMAALLGLESIPRSWIDRLDRKDEITTLADQLAAKKDALYG